MQPQKQTVNIRTLNINIMERDAQPSTLAILTEAV